MLKPTPLPYTYLPPAAQVTVSMGGGEGGGALVVGKYQPLPAQSGAGGRLGCRWN